MRKSIYYTSAVSLLLLFFLGPTLIRGDKENCDNQKKQQTDNANAPSDVFIDLFVRMPSLLDVCPNNAFPFSGSLICAESANISTEKCNKAFHLFSTQRDKKLTDLVKLREAFYDKIMPLLELARDEFAKMPFKATSGKALERVLAYRFLTQNAIFMKNAKNLNCGEQAAKAFLEELLQAKQGCWPEKMSPKLHQVILENSLHGNLDHTFIVVGSTNLPDFFTATYDFLALRMLNSINGTIIDYWNNPQQGGIRLTAHEARKQFNMYSSSSENPIWDSIEVIGFSNECIYKQIEKMNCSDAAKAFLTRHAGPTLDEIEESYQSQSNLFSLSLGI